MKKIVTTIALIMVFSLTAFASHGTKTSLASQDAPLARAIAARGVLARESHPN